MLQLIQTLAQQYHQEFIAVRQHLHAHPELSYHEFETAAYIQSKLSDYNIPFEVMAQTGVVGLIKGQNPGSRVIAIRADIDALPITEKNNISYKSQHEGIMHACGHDVHTACLLGAAKILQEIKDQWQGTVKLIFQPGEEKNPGGANLLIKEGVLKNPAPQAIFGLHVHPSLPTGMTGFNKGKVMASADELYFTITGCGGHAASPHSCIDPILIASHLVIALQQIISRNKDPQMASVLSITAFNGGTTTNVIPAKVELKGTFRAMDETWRFKAHELIKKMSENLITAMGGHLDLHIDVGYPSVYNNELLSARAQQLATEYLGAEQITETEIRMGAEDFGYYTQLIPGCFYRLGVMNENKGIVHGVHTPQFNADEDAIKTGMGLMAWLAVSTDVKNLC